VEATDQRHTHWMVMSPIVDAFDRSLRARGIDTAALSAEAMTARSAAEHAQSANGK